ncbi:ATP-binding protein [Arenimonas composti]|uniref:histidine kinase n=1 Tax=Arenimonas composti TR7-09 = DSM 18010 TaxID=1121013 RepID=A0A091BD88_9GAMM|nr:ATP-binding protein [Arenimonas composti]KFN49447.1 hypothetical protein P873_10770 [Arenimonas composti TR7-09 = DSM 18010]
MSSLRWRLLVAAAAAILVALTIAGLAMTLLFERHLQRQLEADLTRDALALVADLAWAPDGTPRIEGGPVDVRLQTPAGGYYWQAENAVGVARSRSLWDQQLAPAEDAGGDDWRFEVDVAGPFEQRVARLVRRIRDGDGGEATLQLARDLAPLHEARAGFARELALSLALLWAVLSAAAWAQVSLGLRPLDRVRLALQTLRANARQRLPDPGVRELQPLTAAINALADAREADLERARRRAADLAHGLKTPLAALQAQSRRAREAGAVDAAEGMDRAVAAVAAAVEAELARARVAGAGAAAGVGAVGGADEGTSLRAMVERVLSVLERTERGGELAFAVEVDDALRLGIAADLLVELLGPLLENAVRHARRQVRVAAAHDADGGFVLDIDDDGPGIPDDRHREALARGARLDQSGGSGLGLAIARDLADATGGRLALARAGLGGLRVRLTWPRPAA